MPNNSNSLASFGPNQLTSAQTSTIRVEQEPPVHPEHGEANVTVSRLIVAKSQRDDSGHYTCQARNKYGADKMVTNLLVQGKLRSFPAAGSWSCSVE